jgi:hypothetical protein
VGAGGELSLAFKERWVYVDACVYLFVVRQTQSLNPTVAYRYPLIASEVLEMSSPALPGNDVKILPPSTRFYVASTTRQNFNAVSRCCHDNRGHKSTVLVWKNPGYYIRPKCRIRHSGV